MAVAMTALVRLSAFVLRQAERLGADRSEVLRRSGISEEDLRDPDSRIQVRKDLRLWRAIFDLLPDSDLGIRFAERLELRHIGLVGYLMLHSATLAAALERLTRFSRLIDETYPPELWRSGHLAVYSSDVVTLPASGAQRAADWELAAVLALLRKLAGKQIIPVEVRLPYSRCVGLDAHRKFFQAPLSFDHPRREMVLRQTDLDLPVVGADTTLGRHLERHAESIVQALSPAGSVSGKVERALWAGMKNGRFALSDVAVTLGMSERSLQRGLRREGTTFAKQRNLFRRELGVSLLDREDLAIYEIALLLGYSEPSTFYRAFRRWTGSSPRQFRQDSKRRPP
jgi:AraC-like DNA-binding protein